MLMRERIILIPKNGRVILLLQEQLEIEVTKRSFLQTASDFRETRQFRGINPADIESHQMKNLVHGRGLGIQSGS